MAPHKGFNMRRLMVTLVVIANINLLDLSHHTGTVSAQISDHMYGRPPSMTSQARELIVYRVGEQIDLNCSASGHPSPEYEWRKDGQTVDVNWSSYERLPYGGSLRIKEAGVIHESYYQCLASNAHGTALSGVTRLQRAVIGNFFQGGTQGDVNRYSVEEGDKFSLGCFAPVSLPGATYWWSVSKDLIDWSTTLIMSKRIQTDHLGNLHFSHVVKADHQGDYIYKCNVRNKYLDRIASGSYSKIEVTNGSLKFRQPEVMFEKVDIALQGHDAILKCFFSGYPQPSITWSRVKGSLPHSRHQISTDRTELKILDVLPEDEGRYECRGSNTAGEAVKILELIVHAIPVYENDQTKPRDVNVTEGDSVTIQCKTYSRPPAYNIWYKNGKPLDADNMPSGMTISSNRQSLVIRDVCKWCDRQDSRSMVIQCNASNEHGYAFSNGYINVLERTKILTAPVSQQFEKNTTFIFDCLATSDLSTPVLHEWFLNNERVEYVAGTSAWISENGSLHVVTPYDEDEALDSVLGEYRCHVTNGYSHQDASAMLSHHTTELAVASSWSWLWILLLILALILLLLILILCCCACRKLCQSGTYPVDEKEKQSGKDPAQEVADGDFHEYSRPLDRSYEAGSRASIVSSMGGSLNEYGIMDESQFNEDGSFIGLYKNDRKVNNTTANHT